MPTKARKSPGAGTMLTPQAHQLIQDLVDDYHAARGLVHHRQKVSRGVARVVSSLAEERVANYLADTFEAINHIYVDQQLRFASPVKRGKLDVHQPDLVVRIGHEIRLLVDLKMDLGRLREKLPELAKNASTLLRTQRGKFCRTSVRDEPGAHRIKRGLMLGDRCEYVLLVISGRNIQADKLQKMVKKASNYSGVHVIVLWPDEHPNHQERSKATAVDVLTRTLDENALLQFNAIVERCITPA